MLSGVVHLLLPSLKFSQIEGLQGLSSSCMKHPVMNIFLRGVKFLSLAVFCCSCPTCQPLCRHILRDRACIIDAKSGVLRIWARCGKRCDISPPGGLSVCVKPKFSRGSPCRLPPIYRPAADSSCPVRAPTSRNQQKLNALLQLSNNMGIVNLSGPFLHHSDSCTSQSIRYCANVKGEAKSQDSRLYSEARSSLCRKPGSLHLWEQGAEGGIIRTRRPVDLRQGRPKRPAGCGHFAIALPLAHCPTCHIQGFSLGPLLGRP